MAGFPLPLPLERQIFANTWSVTLTNQIMFFFVEKLFCVALIDFLPVSKQIPQFLKKRKLFLESEGGERHTTLSL